MSKLPLSITGVVLMALISVMPVRAQAAAAYVLDLEGTWFYNGLNRLKPGDTLPAGSVIIRRSAFSGDYLTLCDSRGRKLEYASRKCAGQDCSHAIELQPAASSSVAGTVGAYVVAGFNVFISRTLPSPPKKRSRLARGGGLSEGVVKLTDGLADLSSVLSSEGEQYLRWRPISLKDVSSEWTRPVKMENGALISGFRPGLYEVHMMRRNGTSFEPTASAWVLMLDPADFEKAAESFQESRKIAETWKNDVKPETIQLFLHTSLDVLAEGIVR